MEKKGVKPLLDSCSSVLLCTDNLTEMWRSHTIPIRFPLTREFKTKHTKRHKMNEIESVAEEALKLLIEDITDHVFVIIQDNRALMHRYLDQVDDIGKDTVNRTIGKYIKTRLDLTNLEKREDDPQSTLISSYERHGLKDS